MESNSPFNTSVSVDGICAKEPTVEYDFEMNPWSVEDASAFLKYCCPECDYQILNLQMFSEHALENHSKSVALFGPVHTGNVHSFGKISTPDIEEEKMELKRETLDNDDEIVDNDNDH